MNLSRRTLLKYLSSLFAVPVVAKAKPDPMDQELHTYIGFAFIKSKDIEPPVLDELDKVDAGPGHGDPVSLAQPTTNRR